MKTFSNIVGYLSSLDKTKDVKIVTKELDKLWGSLYKYEKLKRQTLIQILNNDYEFNSSLELLEKLVELEKENFYFIDEEPIINNKILSFENLDSIKDKRLTDDQIELVLNTIVQNGREFLSKENNIVRDSLLDFCIKTSRFLTGTFNKYVDIYTLRTDNIYDSSFGHEFNVVQLLHIDGSIKQYIVDITYRQFFLLSKCNENRIYHIFRNDVSPGFFFKDEMIARELLTKGFIEINETTAKIYGDSFILATLTRENIKCENFKLEESVDYSKKEYVKCLMTGMKMNRL